MVAAVTATTVAVQENLEIQRAALKPQEQSPHHQISELHDDYLITGEGKKGITRLKIKLLGRLLEKKNGGSYTISGTLLLTLLLTLPIFDLVV